MIDRTIKWKPFAPGGRERSPGFCALDGDAFTEGRNGAIIPMMNIMYAGGMSHAAEHEISPPKL